MLLPWKDLIAEDAMGNAVNLNDSKLVLAKSGRPVFLYSLAKYSGAQFLEKLLPLDRKNASFFSIAPGNIKTWRLPQTWDGSKKNDSDGSVVKLNEKPIWKLEQIWPPEPAHLGSYQPMIWTGTDWNVKEGGMGGQPGAALKDSVLNLATRAPHGSPPKWRTAGVTFVAPEDGTYLLHGTVDTRIWDGKNKTILRLFKKDAAQATEINKVVIQNLGKVTLDGLSVQLKVGEELCAIPQIEGDFAGGDLKLRDFSISLVPPSPSGGDPQNRYTFPVTWEGKAKGTSEGNPIVIDEKSIWRMEQITSDKYIFADSYASLVWSGTEWSNKQHTQRDSSAKVENGSLTISFPENENEPKPRNLISIGFVAPKSAIYHISAQASLKSPDSKLNGLKLLLLKKDTQRAVEIKSLELLREGQPLSIDEKIELNAGHELMLMPMMTGSGPATAVEIKALKIKLEP